MLERGPKKGLAPAHFFLSTSLVGVSVRTDIKINYNDCENMFIKIVSNFDSSIVNNKRKTIIGVIYRHPCNSYELFQEELSKAIEKLNNCICSFYITGDFNIDLVKQNIDQKV